jgi:hypothetical protein
VIAWQQHDDFEVGPSAPFSELMLATPQGPGVLRSQAVSDATSTGVSGDTAVALLNSSTAVVVWWVLNATGERQLRVSTVALHRPVARHIRVLGSGMDAGTVRAWSDGRRGALITWVSRARTGRHLGRVMALIDPGDRAGAQTTGKVITLSGAGTSFTGPSVTGDGDGHLVVAWTRHGRVETAVGTLTNGLSTRRSLAAEGSGLALNSSPAPIAMLAWASHEHIHAVKVTF